MRLVYCVLLGFAGALDILLTNTPTLVFHIPPPSASHQIADGIFRLIPGQGDFSIAAVIVSNKIPKSEALVSPLLILRRIVLCCLVPQGTPVELFPCHRYDIFSGRD